MVHKCFKKNLSKCCLYGESVKCEQQAKYRSHWIQCVVLIFTLRIIFVKVCFCVHLYYELYLLMSFSSLSVSGRCKFIELRIFLSMFNISFWVSLNLWESRTWLCCKLLTQLGQKAIWIILLDFCLAYFVDWNVLIYPLKDESFHGSSYCLQSFLINLLQ